MPPTTHSRRRSIGMVFGCTILGAAAQMLIKTGAHGLGHSNPLLMLTNLPLMAGYSLYGLSTALLVLALRGGELSILYPIISLTYVWVTMLSVVILQETLNPYKVAGLSVIVLGVAVLGLDRKK